MHRVGQCTGSMNYAKALLSERLSRAVETARVMHHPLIDLQMRKGAYVPSERLRPEADDIAPILRAH